jgi:P-type E1-E2 ATPase
VSPDNLYIGTALLMVVIISGVFAYYQEDKSGRIMEGFEKMVPPTARVMRESRVQNIVARDVVVGDVIEIAGGDKVPADLRILEASGLKVSEL